jgi:hypothetical protein
MTATAARISTAAVAAFLSIVTLGGAQAGQTQQNPDPQLCAEYLQDLATYRRMAVLAGCAIPDAAQAPAAAARTAVVEDDATSFPPVITGEAEPEETNFPPVITGSSDDTPAAGTETTQTSTTEASTTETSTAETSTAETSSTEPAQTEDTPVASAETTSSSESSSSEEHASTGESETSPPIVTGHREEIEQELILLKEEAKARIKEAIILKAEEVKERIKQKIKDKLEHASDKQAPEGQNLRSKAKLAVKRMIAEHHSDSHSGNHSGNHSGSGLLNKLAQLRNR